MRDRAIAILGALRGSAVPPGIANRVIASFIPPGGGGGTNDELAAYFIHEVRRLVKERILFFEEEEAAETARTNARDSVNKEVDLGND